MVVIQRDTQFLDDLHSLENYILDEVNVRQLVVSSDKDKYGVKLKAEPNFRLLGARLKSDQKKVANYLKVGARPDMHIISGYLFRMISPTMSC
jgi:isoleucyl-tRNA synthetase